MTSRTTNRKFSHSLAQLSGKGSGSFSKLAAAEHPPAKSTGSSNDPCPQQNQRRRLRHCRRRRRRSISSFSRNVPGVAVAPRQVGSKEIASCIPNEVRKSDAGARSNSKHHRTRRIAILAAHAGGAGDGLKKASEGRSRVWRGSGAEA